VSGGLPTPSSSLHTIDLSSNPIESITGVEHIHTLEELWMTSTQLKTMEDLTPLVALPALSCVYLEHSPLAQMQGYHEKLQALIPTLVQIDANMI